MVILDDHILKIKQEKENQVTFDEPVRGGRGENGRKSLVEEDVTDVLDGEGFIGNFHTLHLIVLSSRFRTIRITERLSAMIHVRTVHFP